MQVSVSSAQARRRRCPRHTNRHRVPGTPTSLSSTSLLAWPLIPGRDTPTARWSTACWLFAPTSRASAARYGPGHRAPAGQGHLRPDDCPPRTSAPTTTCRSRLRTGKSRRSTWRSSKGAPSPESGRNRSPDRPADPRRRTRMAVTAEGRESRTGYRLLELAGRFSLLELTLHTGRTHQARVHLAWLGHPLLGDATYGRRSPLLSPPLPARPQVGLRPFPPPENRYGSSRPSRPTC